MDIPKQENIKEEIRKAFEALDAIRAQKTMIVSRIDMLRQICNHPEKIPVIHIGHSFTKCTTCGKEW